MTTSSNSIGIRAAQIIADLPHDHQDLVAEAIRNPSEAKRLVGELARLRAEDAFEIEHETLVQDTVQKAAREAMAYAEVAAPTPTPTPKNGKRSMRRHAANNVFHTGTPGDETDS